MDKFTAFSRKSGKNRLTSFHSSVIIDAYKDMGFHFCAKRPAGLAPDASWIHAFCQSKIPLPAEILFDFVFD